MKEKLEWAFRFYQTCIEDENIKYIYNTISVYDCFAVINHLLLLPLDTRYIEMVVSNVCNIINNQYDVLLEYHWLRNHDILLTIGGCNIMKKIFNIQIPYGYREKYFEAINEINKIVEKEGIVALFVNNIPYCLESILYVESQCAEEVMDVVNRYHLQLLEYGKHT